MDEVTISPAGDPFTARSKLSTRCRRCTHDFIELLEQDFGIPRYALVNAFMGMPAEHKRRANSLCEWAARADDPGRALLAWARKNRRGTFSFDDADDEL